MTTEIPPRLKRGVKKFRLTPRETEVVAAALGDSTVKIIGDKLGISPRTVDWHFRKIFKKVSAHTRAGVISAALNPG